MEQSVQETVADDRCGDVGDLSRVGTGNADTQAHGKRGDPDGEARDDDEGEHDCCPSEAAAHARVQLAQLTDRSRRRLSTGGQCHRDWEREQDCRQRRSQRAGDRSRALGCRRVREAVRQHHRAGPDEKQGHEREDKAPAMPVPGQARHHDEKREAQYDPQPGEAGQVGDERTDARCDRDGDGEHEVDDQRADGDEDPAGPEGPSRSFSRPSPEREAAD